MAAAEQGDKEPSKAEYAYSQRVKVYRLNDDGKWDDKGTGRVSVEYLEKSTSMGLVVIDEEDTATLLVHRISADDIYQRQEDTIISWTDPELATDLALSFQQSLGCAYIWDQICCVQRRIQIRGAAGQDMDGQDMRDDIMDLPGVASPLKANGSLMSENGDLPAVGLRNLSQIVKIVSEIGIVPFQRDRIATSIQRENYVPKLLELFKVCEDLGNMEGLHDLYRIFKGLILLNDGHIMDILFSDNNIIDVIGALEYDPEMPFKQEYRQFLMDQVVYREVLPIQDPNVRSKIHQSYRLGYIKDVILPRALDDQTFGSFNSLILFNNVEVVTFLQNDRQFLTDLFNLLLKTKASTSQEWRELVRFLQDFCALHKQLPPGQRHQSFSTLISLGLFDVVTLTLQSGDETVSLAGVDILMAVLAQDPSAVRAYLVDQDGHTLFSLLVGGITSGTEGGLQATLLEMMRMLLDSTSMEQSEKQRFLDMFYEKYMEKLMGVLLVGAEDEREQAQSSAEAGGSQDDQRQKGSRRISGDVLVTVCELLSFCVQQHSFRIKYYVLRNNLVEKVLRLTKRPERPLVLAAIRFLRTCVGLKDPFYLRYLVKHKLFEPAMAVFSSNGRRYNMINSAVLELLDFVRKENLKECVAHIVENYSEILDAVDYCETGRMLRLKYEQNAEAGVAGGDREQGMGAAGHTLGGPAGNGALGPEKEDAEEPHFESGFAARGRGAGAGAHRGGGRKGRGGMGRGMLRRFKEERTVEREEEDYFEKDGDDDSPDEEAQEGPKGQGGEDQSLEDRFVPMKRKGMSPPSIALNGIPPSGPSAGRLPSSPRPGFGLVDYNDDDDDDEEDASEGGGRPPSLFRATPKRRDGQGGEGSPQRRGSPTEEGPGAKRSSQGGGASPKGGPSSAAQQKKRKPSAGGGGSKVKEGAKFWIGKGSGGAGAGKKDDSGGPQGHKGGGSPKGSKETDLLKAGKKPGARREGGAPDSPQNRQQQQPEQQQQQHQQVAEEEQGEEGRLGVADARDEGQGVRERDQGSAEPLQEAQHVASAKEGPPEGAQGAGAGAQPQELALGASEGHTEGGARAQEHPPAADEDMTDAGSLEGAAGATLVSPNEPHPVSREAASRGAGGLDCPPHQHQQVQEEPPKAQVEAAVAMEQEPASVR